MFLSTKGFLILIFLGISTLLFGVLYLNNLEDGNLANLKSAYADFDLLTSSNSGVCTFFANPYDPRILKYIKPSHPPVECHPRQDKQTELINNTLTLINPDAECKYRYFGHNTGVDDFTVKYEPWISLNSSSLSLKNDLIDVSCTNKLGFETYRYQWATVVPKNISIITGKPFQDESEDHLSVLMFGFDGLSKSNFIRQMPKSKAKLDKLDFVTMEKYSKIADNTFPNWMAIHLGQHTWNTEFKGTVDGREHIAYDNWTKLLWPKFGTHGYATYFSEDVQEMATFNYRGRAKGFIKRQPSDHYLRPWFLALDEHYLKARSSTFCYDDTPTHKLYFNYAQSFIKGYKGKRKFLWNWSVETSHDYLNDAGILDADFVELLENIEAEVNNSIVIVFSDHGNRYDVIRETVVGRLESRLPLLSIRMPKWFEKKHPKLMRNLKANSQVLTSHFDLHATLMQLLGGKFDQFPKLPRGQSLFSRISENRTCYQAEIPAQYCPCFHEVELPPSNGTIYANMILSRIHGIFEDKNVLDKCLPMELDSVKSVSLSLPPADLTIDQRQPTLKSGVFHYRVQFSVKSPSNALFEGVVVRDRSNNLSVLNDIERNNKYGDSSHCVDDALLKKLCHCIQ